MTELFLNVLERTAAGSYVIAVILIARMVLKRAPRVYSYALWSVAALRLMIPFSVTSFYSLFPKDSNPQFLPPDLLLQASPRIQTGLPALDMAVNQILPKAEPIASVNPLQIVALIGTWLWLIGIILLTVTSLISYTRLKHLMKCSRHLRDNVYEQDHLPTAFALGLFSPRIYLPAGLTPTEAGQIVHHEGLHLRRHDPLWKLLGYFTVIIHWFNPLVWLGFHLMTQDMEMACDEAVIQEAAPTSRSAYARTLLRLATEPRFSLTSPLAFNEGNVSRRIRHILQFRHPRRWISALSILLVTGCSIGLLSDPASTPVTLPITMPVTTTITEPATTSKTTPPATVIGRKLTVTPVKLPDALAKGIGSDMPSIAFADDEILIFNAYFGLFVYDLVSDRLISSLDLVPIGCNYTQGDAACQVQVSPDGSLVQLQPANSPTMFRYSVADQTLIGDLPGQPMKNAFPTIPIQEVSGTKAHSLTSERAVKFSDGSAGYLTSEDWGLSTLSYQRNGKSYRLFHQYLK